MKFPDTNDIRYRCNDIDECRKSNDVEQERIARVNLVIMMTDIDEKTFGSIIFRVDGNFPPTLF